MSSCHWSLLTANAFFMDACLETRGIASNREKTLPTPLIYAILLPKYMRSGVINICDLTNFCDPVSQIYVMSQIYMRSCFTKICNPVSHICDICDPVSQIYAMSQIYMRSCFTKIWDPVSVWGIHRRAVRCQFWRSIHVIIS